MARPSPTPANQKAIVLAHPAEASRVDGGRLFKGEKCYTPLPERDLCGRCIARLRRLACSGSDVDGYVFGIFASLGEFERQLIRERVRSGLAGARARGKRLGRPPSRVDADKVAELRAQGASWHEIAALLGVGIGTVHRAARERLKDHSLAAPVGS